MSNKKHILAIDPGSEQSAWVLIGAEYRPLCFDITENNELLNSLRYGDLAQHTKTAVIEMIASYGMPVGKEVFETCVWIGKFSEALYARRCEVERIFRKDVKMNLCNCANAKDSNVIQALKDRFGDKGTKKNPGWFYGFRNDIWQSYAAGISYKDLVKSGEFERVKVTE